MAYCTANEIANFDFSESVIRKLTVKKDQLDIRCADVMIPVSNSQNTDVEKLGTDELLVSLLQRGQMELKKDGYRVYNLDDTIREEIPDECIAQEEWESCLETLEGEAIYSITKEGDVYRICIDTAQPEVSYTITIQAQGDQESWESQHRLPPHLRG